MSASQPDIHCSAVPVRPRQCTAGSAGLWQWQSRLHCSIRPNAFQITKLFSLTKLKQHNISMEERWRHLANIDTAQWFITLRNSMHPWRNNSSISCCWDSSRYNNISDTARSAN